jgi:hypothetical protein
MRHHIGHVGKNSLIMNNPDLILRKSMLTKNDAITRHVGDSPEGPLKQPGESCLKPSKNQNETPLT